MENLPLSLDQCVKARGAYHDICVCGFAAPARSNWLWVRPPFDVTQG